MHLAMKGQLVVEKERKNKLHTQNS